MISLDTETTGIDLYHGARPFLVTICTESGENLWWEWDVDPLTRVIQAVEEDLQEIQSELDSTDIVAMQNAKFDYGMLTQLYNDNDLEFRLDWSKVRDTLISGHLLASNHPHDLSSMAIEYLSINIEKYEVALKTAVRKARAMARRNQFVEKHGDWMLAKAGQKGIPSASDGNASKLDYWLPRAITKVEFNEEHKWSSIVSSYANADSAVTLALYQKHLKLLKRRNLLRIYEERMRCPEIALSMENGGITVSESRLTELTKEYAEESELAGNICSNIADGYGYDLELPKSGNNNSLKNFCFEVMELPILKKSKKTGEPSMDKGVLNHWLETLPDKSKQLTFVKRLQGKRKRDTALSYMKGYRRFWIPRGNGWYMLNPNLNPTGTDTLRWSSNKPNEQNISKQEGFNLRYCFGPAPGREWWSLDYDNLELRLPAYECGEPAMLALFEHPDEAPFFGSYHLLIFSILHPDKYDHKDPQGLVKARKKYKSTWYQRVKNGNFADQYGAVMKADGEGTADRTYGIPGAQRMVAQRLTKKAGLNRYWINYAKQHGYVETMPDKEVDPERGYPLICGVGRWGGIKPTIPLNYRVQGTACWVMMRAMIKIQDYFKTLNQQNPGKNYRMCMQVHDEIVLDFPKRKNKGNLPLVKKVRRLMESCGTAIGVPLTCGIDYNLKNWSESEEI